MDRQALGQETRFAAELGVADDGAAAIYAWRLEQLERAGYSRQYAEALAQEESVDLHQACDLLELGCSQHTAFLILT